MAETLYLSSGGVKVIFDKNNKEQILSDIIREKLGRDCEELFYHIIQNDTEQDCGDDYESIADGYRAMLMSAVEELDEALLLFNFQRLKRSDLQKMLQRCRNNIYNNL